MYDVSVVSQCDIVYAIKHTIDTGGSTGGIMWAPLPHKIRKGNQMSSGATALTNGAGRRAWAPPPAYMESTQNRGDRINGANNA